MSPEDERKERRRRRAKRYYDSLSPEQRIVDPRAVAWMQIEGLANEDGTLTELGQFRLH